MSVRLKRLFIDSTARLAVAIVLGGPVIASEDAKPPPPTPTQRDIAYGPHERNTLDFYQAQQAQGDGPRPLVMVIHGGGWLNNDKTKFAEGGFSKRIERLLEQGISVACINYRLTRQTPLPAPVHDAARAVQFLRYNAEAFGIDKTRIAAAGSSAGGCSALWLATHDDLADPDAGDPVLRESTRLVGAWVSGAQTTIDPHQIKRWIGDSPLEHAMIRKAGGFESNEQMMANYEQAAALYHEFSPVNHLSPDDPPLLLGYSDKVREGIHSAVFGEKFKAAADSAGVTCHLDLTGRPGAKRTAPRWDAFLLEVLAAQEPKSRS